MTPEERCERVRMALAEAGYPYAEVTWEENDVKVRPRSLPPEAVWRAYTFSRIEAGCWPCWLDWTNDPAQPETIDCDHDPLTSPWPEVVR